MLVWLTKRLHRRAATLLVVLYAGCLFVPSAAFALADAPRQAHCLTQANHGLAKAHVHHDGERHEHSQNPRKSDDQNNQLKNCCGLFCLTALTPAIDLAIGQFPVGSTLVATLEDVVARGAPGRLDRPPISLLSF
jgi:hypothetical protein